MPGMQAVLVIVLGDCSRYPLSHSVYMLHIRRYLFFYEGLNYMAHHRICGFVLSVACPFRSLVGMMRIGLLPD